MILIVDNYDSFVHNVARYFEELSAATRVVRAHVPGAVRAAAERRRRAPGGLAVMRRPGGWRDMTYVGSVFTACARV